MKLSGLDQFSPGLAGVVERWRSEIAIAEDWLKDWHRVAQRVVDRYDMGEAAGKGGSDFNILWSNTETIRPTIFGQVPKADIRRRWRQKDPTSRAGAEVLSRGVDYLNDSASPDVYDQYDAGLTDLLTAGAMVLRVRYKPQYSRREIPLHYDEEEGIYLDPETWSQVPEDAVLSSGEDAYTVEEELIFERADVEYVYWKDWLHNPARSWKDVRWFAFRHFFSRDEIRRAFGPAKANRCTYGHFANVSAGDTAADLPPDQFMKTQVFEIWDKDRREVIFLADGLDDSPLGKFDDPQGHREFFPTAGVLRSVRRTNTLLPLPEYLLYQNQALSLDLVTARIDGLTETLRAAGVYDSSIPALKDLVNGGGNRLIPVDNWASLAAKGGLDGVISWVPLADIAAALGLLYQQRTQLLDTIYQLVGIADIQRGSTDPNETLGAQELKGQYGSLRIQPRRAAFARYLAATMNLQAELLAEKCSITTLEIMSGISITPDVATLLRNDALRNFQINVETDQTSAVDSRQERADTVEFFTAVGQFASSLQALGLPPDVSRGMLLAGVRKWKMGAEVEDLIENAEQPAPPPPSLADQAKMLDAQTRRQAVAVKQREVEGKAREAAQRLALEARELGMSERELRGRSLLEVIKLVQQARQSQARRTGQTIEGRAEAVRG